MFWTSESLQRCMRTAHSLRVTVACYIHEECKEVDGFNISCPEPINAYCPSSVIGRDKWEPIMQAYLKRRQP